MLHYTNDPIRDAENYQADQEEWLKSRPICDQCGEHIQEEFMFQYEGENYCPDCWDDKVNDEFFRRIDYEL